MKTVWLKDILLHEFNSKDSRTRECFDALWQLAACSIAISLYEPDGQPSLNISQQKNGNINISEQMFDDINYSCGKSTILQNCPQLEGERLFYPLSYLGKHPYGFCYFSNAKKLFKNLDKARQFTGTAKVKYFESLLPAKFVDCLKNLADLIYAEAMGEILGSKNNVLFSCKHLSKCFGSGTGKVNALQNVNFEIYKNELTIINGASGSGKTTLLNILAGIMKPDSGKLMFEGERIDDMKHSATLKYRREKIGFIYQNYNLIAGLNVLENVRVASYLVDDHMDEMQVLDLVNLGDKAYSFPRQLSGGQQQRVCIARALVKKPSVLFCDEPTGALDTENSMIVLNVIKDLIANHGVTVVMITHNPEISLMGDHCVTMSNGSVINEYIQPFPKSSENLVLS